MKISDEPEKGTLVPFFAAYFYDSASIASATPYIRESPLPRFRPFSS